MGTVSESGGPAHIEALPAKTRHFITRQTATITRNCGSAGPCFSTRQRARNFKSAEERNHRWKVEVAPHDHVDGASASSEIQNEGVEHVADSFPDRDSGVRSVHVKPEGVPSAVDWPANL